MSQLAKCQGITKSGTKCTRTAQYGSLYCWQHQNVPIINMPKQIINKQIIRKLNLRQLPTDMLANIGSYLELKEIVLNQKRLRMPALSLRKDCAILQEYDRKKLESLHDNFPQLKDLSLYDNLEDDLYDENTPTFDITPIAKFKKLDALYVLITTMSRIPYVNWSRLRNLKFLGIDTFVKWTSQILDIITALPNLQHLLINANLYELISTDKKYNIKLDTLELKGESDWSLDFKHFDGVRQIICDNPDTAFLNQLAMIKNLEVLRINGDYGFRNDASDQFNSSTFPRHIQFLEIINFRDPEEDHSSLLSISLNELEFFSLEQESLNYLMKLLLELPKLKYLYFPILGINDLDKTFKNLQTLKIQHPDLQLGLGKIYAGRGQLDAQIWKIIKELFNIPHFYKDFYKLYDIPLAPTITPEWWLLEHNFYIPIRCNEEF